MTENKKRIVDITHMPGSDEIEYKRADGSSGTTSGTADDAIRMMVDSRREGTGDDGRHSLAGGYSSSGITNAATKSNSPGKEEGRLMGGGYSAKGINENINRDVGESGYSSKGISENMTSTSNKKKNDTRSLDDND